ncbi:MAG: hypothetical protein BMS9Abin23_0561 [Thermodesulfobacteriota bacterium]|nr:MAG: hypothetical protein BMS9Abin23_0561 [Thermodesulfobacteriota bacterium]
MKIHRFADAEIKSVSHDPQLKKRLLVEKSISCISNLSHIKLVPGQTAVPHCHEGAYEVFYCISGRVVFGFGEEEAAIGAGDVLVAGPDEEHSIKRVVGDSELLYFFAAAPPILARR